MTDHEKFIYKCTTEIECTTCAKQGISADCDPDSSDQAWEYYEHVYKDEEGKYNEKLKFLSGLNNDKINDKNYQLKISTNRLIAETIDNTIPDFGGDTLFNFKYRESEYKRYQGKYQSFKNIIDNLYLDTEKKDLHSQLLRCAKNHHSLLNFSLMPSTGGLNNFKGTHCQLDRFDCFINELTDYYGHNKANKDNTREELNRSIKNIKQQNTKLENYKIYNPALVRNNFLNNFLNVEDYCKQVYFIGDNDFINRLIMSGQKTIQYTKKAKDSNIETLKEYMDLAEDYWEMRHNQIQKNLCNSCKQGNCNSNKYYYTNRHGDSKSYCYHDNCKPEISI